MDPILYWNAVALEANRRDFSNVPGTNAPAPEQGGPTLSSRALAIIHLAMYDAYAGVVNVPALPRYLASPANPPAGANAGAAVAAAAHTCLSALFPRQKPHFDAAHAGAGITGTGVVAGQTFGLSVARAMLADRAADPRAGEEGYASSMAPGAHRVDPSRSGQGYHAPHYGARSKGFAITNRHVLAAPPALGTTAYTRALKQVRGKGIKPELMGTLPNNIPRRTVDETLVGLFWAYDGVRELGTPPRLYNQIVRQLAMEKSNTVEQNARLFALVNAAMGDAGILAWDQKYIHDLWRPVLGVREHDASMGPVAPTPTNNIDDDCDPDWLPLGAPSTNGTENNATPPFPAYPSGHATFGAAALHMVRLFYGVAAGNHAPDPHFPNAFVSDELNGVNRDNGGVVRPLHKRLFPGGLWQMIVENGFSRVWLGVHWHYDAFELDSNGNAKVTGSNIGGVPLGLKIAEDIFNANADHTPMKSTVLPRS